MIFFVTDTIFRYMWQTLLSIIEIKLEIGDWIKKAWSRLERKEKEKTDK